jgi:di/tricarboxylate transporter
MSLQNDTLIAAALIFLTVGLWAGGKLPEYLTTLIFFSVATAASIAPPSVIFSGFSSAAFWLVISGYVIGIAISKTGLAERVAGLLSTRLGTSYPRMVFGTVSLSYALAFIMPSSMGRVALLMPIILSLAKRCELKSGRNGLALAVGLATFQLSASILPANVPNLVMAGAVEAAYKTHLSYLPYLIMNAPVLGVIKGLVVSGCVVLLFPDQASAKIETKTPEPFTRAEKKLAVLIAITLAFWATDALHGVGPAWVGLVAACICLLPKVGFVTAEEFGKDVNHRAAIYVAGILGVASLASYSGVAQLVGNEMISFLSLEPDATLLNFMSIVGISTALNFIVTANGVPALFTPLADTLASASGFTTESVLMFQIVGYGTPILPYQASPIVIAIAMAKVPHSAAIRLCIVVAAVTFLTLTPLQYMWLHLLGVFR